MFLGTIAAVRQTNEQKYIKVPVKRKPADKDWTLRETRTIELLENFQPGSKKIATGRYGGRADKKAEATGFFYSKKIAGRWWLIDPEGNLFINVGVCSVNIGRSKISQEPAIKMFGTPEKWAQFSTEFLAGQGFNGTGGWSDTELLRTSPHRLALVQIQRQQSGRSEHGSIQPRFEQGNHRLQVQTLRQAARRYEETQ